MIPRNDEYYQEVMARPVEERAHTRITSKTDPKVRQAVLNARQSLEKAKRTPPPQGGNGFLPDKTIDTYFPRVKGSKKEKAHAKYLGKLLKKEGMEKAPFRMVDTNDFAAAYGPKIGFLGNENYLNDKVGNEDKIAWAHEVRHYKDYGKGDEGQNKMLEGLKKPVPGHWLADPFVNPLGRNTLYETAADRSAVLNTKDSLLKHLKERKYIFGKKPENWVNHNDNQGYGLGLVDNGVTVGNGILPYTNAVNKTYEKELTGLGVDKKKVVEHLTKYLVKDMKLKGQEWNPKDRALLDRLNKHTQENYGFSTKKWSFE